MIPTLSNPIKILVYGKTQNTENKYKVSVAFSL